MCNYNIISVTFYTNIAKCHQNRISIKLNTLYNVFVIKLELCAPSIENVNTSVKLKIYETISLKTF